MARGELLGAGARQHDVFGLLHHRTREFNRVADAREAANRAGLQSAPFHDRGVHFIAAVEREHRAASGIEQGIVFEQHDRAADRVQAGAAFLQHRITRIDRLGQAGAVLAFRIAAHLGPGQSAGAAVNYYAKHRLCISLVLRNPHLEPLEICRDMNLAAQAAIVARLPGALQRAFFHFLARAKHRQPCRIDIDMAGAACTGAAA